MTRNHLYLIPAFVMPLIALVGCLVPMPNGSAIRISASLVPQSELMTPIPALEDQSLDAALTFGEMASTAINPILGALLYQFVLRPLRLKRRRRKQKEMLADLADDEAYAFEPWNGTYTDEPRPPATNAKPPKEPKSGE